MCTLRVIIIKIGLLEDFCENRFWKHCLIKKSRPKWQKKALELNLEGLRCPPEVRVEHKTCSAICWILVQAIWDHYCVFGIICFPQKCTHGIVVDKFRPCWAWEKQVFPCDVFPPTPQIIFLGLARHLLKRLVIMLFRLFCFQYWIFINLLLHKMPIIIFSRHGLEFSLTINRPLF